VSINLNGNVTQNVSRQSDEQVMQELLHLLSQHFG